MDATHQFALVMCAVLSANLLTGCFFWGLMRYSQLEREGRDKGKDAHTPLLAMSITSGFLVLSLLTVLG